MVFSNGGFLALPDADVLLDGGGLFARTYGRGEAVVLIHGNSGSSFSFAELLPLLPRGWYYIIPDLPGHGSGPEMPNHFLDDPTLASRYILDVLDGLGIHTFAAIGHSLGGMIALNLAIADAPARTKGIMLLDSFVAFHERREPLLRLDAYPGSPRLMYDKVNDAFDDGPGVRWHEPFDVSAEAIKFTIPVSELIGASNPDTESLFDAWRAKYRAGYPDAWNTQIIPHAGHFLHVEQPCLVADAARKWLECL